MYIIFHKFLLYKIYDPCSLLVIHVKLYWNYCIKYKQQKILCLYSVSNLNCAHAHFVLFAGDNDSKSFQQCRIQTHQLAVEVGYPFRSRFPCSRLAAQKAVLRAATYNKNYADHKWKSGILDIF